MAEAAFERDAVENRERGNDGQHEARTDADRRKLRITNRALRKPAHQQRQCGEPEGDGAVLKDHACVSATRPPALSGDELEGQRRTALLGLPQRAWI